MLWIKTFHIVAVVSWFAGLLYLPRLFVYHAECDDEIGRQRFCVMEKTFVLAHYDAGGDGGCRFGAGAFGL